MQGADFDEAEFFASIERSGARALLIGRRALVALGLPVMTGDYDFWIHVDDGALFNAAAGPIGLRPNRAPEEARRVGRYALENDERVDVLVARFVPTVDGVRSLSTRSDRAGERSIWALARASPSRRSTT